MGRVGELRRPTGPRRRGRWPPTGGGAGGLLATACGDDDETDASAGDDTTTTVAEGDAAASDIEEYCAATAELDDAQGPPTAEQMERIKELAPEEIRSEVIAVTAVDFEFEGIPDEVPAGDVSFEVTNEGEAAHEDAGAQARRGWRHG